MKAHKEEFFMKDEKNIHRDTQIALLEQSIGHINETLIRFEKRFDSLDNRLEEFNKDMKQGFKDINNRLWTNFFWMIGGFSGILGIVAHALRWI